jgi:putative phosphoesterase
VKLGICSDSHDHLANLRAVMAEFARRGCGAVVHAGDFVAPFTIDAMKLADCPVYGVFGNNDGEVMGLTTRWQELEGELAREPHLWELGGLQVVVMHHPDWVEAFSREGLADVVVYGHTHELEVRGEEPLVINPGELFGQMSGRGATAVVLDTESREVEVIEVDEIPTAD